MNTIGFATNFQISTHTTSSDEDLEAQTKSSAQTEQLIEIRVLIQFETTLINNAIYFVRKKN